MYFVTGAGGALGSVLMRELHRAGARAEGMVSPAGPRPVHGQVFAGDLADPRTYRDRVRALTPAVIVHLGAIASPAVAFRDPERARTINVESTARLLSVAEALGAHFVYASTDLVFDGEAAPYREDAAPDPRSVYARTKLEAESYVLAYRLGLVLRFPLMYGLPDVARAPTFFEVLLARLRAGQPCRMFTDEYRTPLWLDDAARACLRVAGREANGTLHLGGPERLSRFEMGTRIAAALGASSALIEPASRSDFAGDEPRVRDVSLTSERFAALAGAPPGRPMHEALPLLLAASSAAGEVR